MRPLIFRIRPILMQVPLVTRPFASICMKIWSNKGLTELNIISDYGSRRGFRKHIESHRIYSTTKWTSEAPELEALARFGLASPLGSAPTRTLDSSDVELLIPHIGKSSNQDRLASYPVTYFSVEALARFGRFKNSQDLHWGLGKSAKFSLFYRILLVR